MIKNAICAAVLMLLLSGTVHLTAGEREIPVDIFVMIDKSLSMGEDGRFESMHDWVRNHLLGQILISGDWITIYQFYGQTDKLLEREITGETDRAAVLKTIDAIRPDGQYTDIGIALDTLKGALSRRGENGRYKIMLLLTDLRQEAPWSSRYAGVADRFDSPYLAEARIVTHDTWYEITLDMDIQDRVVQTSKELFTVIEENRDNTIATAEGGAALDSISAVAGGQSGATDVDIANTADSPAQTEVQSATAKGSAGNPLLALGILALAGIAGAAGVFTVRYIRSRKDDSDDRKKKNGRGTLT